jgi:nucleolar protein 4
MEIGYPGRKVRESPAAMTRAEVSEEKLLNAAASVPATASAQKSPTTLFVRNLPFACTNAELEQFFSEFGPLKGCFVVAEHSAPSESPATAPGRNRGIGFVHFALSEDAKKTMEALNVTRSPIKFKGRALKADWASPLGQTGVSKTPLSASKPTKSHASLQSAKPAKAVDPEKLAETECRRLKLTVTIDSSALEKPVESLASQPALLKLLRRKMNRYGPVESDLIPEGDTSFVVVFKNVKDAVKAYRRLLGRLKLCVLMAQEGPAASASALAPESKGKKPRNIHDPTSYFPKLPLVSVEPLLPESLKSFRLIIRNLPFSITRATQLTDYLQPFGRVLDITLPPPVSNEHARYAREAERGRGFAFVQYSQRSEAEKALEALNGSIVKTRPVAVDWAVAKNVYDELQKTEDVKETGQMEDFSEGFVIDKTGTRPRVEEEQDESEDEDEDEDVNEDDDEDEDMDDNEEEEKASSAAESSIDSLEAAESLSEEQGNRTVFIRNLSFDTEEHSLEAFITQHWGSVEYCKIVRNEETGGSRGTAFVAFKKAKEADRIIEASEAANALRQPDAALMDLAERRRKRPSSQFRSIISDPDALWQADGSSSGSLLLDGRQLQVMWAVQRQEASVLAKRRAMDQIESQLPDSMAARDAMLEKLFSSTAATEKSASGVPRLQRNLLLIKEALAPASPELEDEVAARQAVVRHRARLAAKNPNLVVSTTRLAVHHLPGRVDQPRLREVLYAGMRKARTLALQKENPLGLSGKLIAAVKELDKLPKTALGMRALKLILHRAKADRRDSRPVATSSTGDAKSRGYGFVEWKHPLQALLCVRYFRDPANWLASDISQMIGSRARALARDREAHSNESSEAAVVYPVVEFATEKDDLLLKQKQQQGLKRKAERVEEPSKSGRPATKREEAHKRGHKHARKH